MVLNEAASFGVPLISSYYLGVEDIIDFDKNGFYYEKEEDAVTYLLSVLENKSKWEEMSQNCIRKVGAFSEKELMKRWKKLIKLTINRPDIEDFKEFKSLTNSRPLSDMEVKFITKEYEEIVEGASKRINRADAAQDFLYANWQDEKQWNVKQFSLKQLIKLVIKRLLHKI